MKFRKKPVVVEAKQFFPSQKPWPEGVEEYHSKTLRNAQGLKEVVYAWRIDTLEGPMEVRPRDWIVKGVAGEFYPCKPDIFEKTYEPVLLTEIERAVQV